MVVLEVVLRAYADFFFFFFFLVIDVIFCSVPRPLERFVGWSTHGSFCSGKVCVTKGFLLHSPGIVAELDTGKQDF